jgi:hypothetical protein
VSHDDDTKKAAPSSTPTTTSGPVLDREKADEMREKLHALFAEAGPLWADDEIDASDPVPLSATGRPLAPMPSGTIIGDGGTSPLAEYVKDRMREDFMPLARQCYEHELEKDPKFSGRFVLKYRIVGDKHIGGVVDSAVYDDEKTTMKSASFAQCMTESMMSVSFGAPPEDQHEINITYPYVFSAGDEPPDAD